MKQQQSHLLMLLLAAFFWGTTFVAQRIGADYVGPFTYLACRSWIAVAFLTPVVHFLDRIHERRGRESRRPRSRAERRLLLIAGIATGCSLCAASAAQQHGMAFTSASKAGFITALYVVLVPLISMVFGRRPALRIWLCVALSLLGMYLLCLKREHFSLAPGDAFVLLSALLFSVEILVVDHFSPLVDGVRLSRLQFLVVAVLSTGMMLGVERPGTENLVKALPAILYAGVFSSSIAYTLQILGQENVNPSLASLAMSMESVFSALSGALVLGERLSGRELLGCVLMFAAILLAQIEIRPRKKPRDG